MPTPDSTHAFLAQLERQARRSDAESRIERQLSAATKEAIRWGRVDRRTQHFQPPWRSGDAAIYESQDLMHRRTRSEVLNNAQIKKIVEALVDLIVGPGMLTFADPFGPSLDLDALSRDTLDAALTYALEADDLFDEWWLDPTQFDAAGKRSGPDFQRQVLSECVERGGCLLVRSTRSGRERVVPRQWQLVEYDQLDLSHDRAASPGTNKIVHGIELDAAGREVAFWIYDDHPYDDFAGTATFGKSSRVSADRVIHVCLFKRPSQSIGASWLHAIGQNNFDRDKFIGAELQKAAKSALLLLVHYAKNLAAGGNLGLLDGEDSSDEHGNEEMKLGSSPVALRVHADDEVELLEGDYPTSSADSFIGILDHDTAGGAGTTKRITRRSAGPCWPKTPTSGRCKTGSRPCSRCRSAAIFIGRRSASRSSKALPPTRTSPIRGDSTGSMRSAPAASCSIRKRKPTPRRASSAQG